MTIAYTCDLLAREERQMPVTQAMDYGIQNYLLERYDGNLARASADLKDLAIYALSTNPTIGVVERNWSVHGFIQNKSRNQLGNPKVEMLMYLFTNLRIRDQINSEEPQYFDDSEVEEEEEPEVLDDDNNGDLLQVIEGLAIAKEINWMTKLTNYDE
ncbi:hypothetical protein K469DRAFT_694105 [Zopfia rhizophila CBS 207.26]|uniref:HAT C-terminal dimerisation domain-containing protein n=1 Tax=Zopfia rhizophila CBS 207.26 TaxID=1314779 RepID=A0A6A6DIU5_9PEZI|nr:hypothetical protein K469DRAFT_694105 [Zopfia rhizophila CBS 207.26]